MGIEPVSGVHRIEAVPSFNARRYETTHNLILARLFVKVPRPGDSEEIFLVV